MFGFLRGNRHDKADSRRIGYQNAGVARLRKARWNLRRGDCDCLCDPSCCEVGGGGCNCDPSAGDCLICADCGDCCVPSGRKAGREQGISDASKFSRVGMTGHAAGPLSPSGAIAVGDRSIPAQSDGEWIDAGTEVVIVAEQGFGVTVRRQDSPV